MKKIEQLTWGMIIAGSIYAFVPHALHHQYKIDFGLPHGTHQMIGYGLLAGAYFYHKRKDGN